MSLPEAPYHADVAEGFLKAKAFWAQTSDGMRIRLGLWQAATPRGTVFMFPGRTEYIEKYAPVADGLATLGLNTFSIDWRGQGLADRMLDNPRVGHVLDFKDYQKDVASLIEAAEAMALPKPWFLLGHSMGGCIGLRSLIEGLPVAHAAFTGPMWGIRIAKHLQPLAFVLKRLMPAVGLGHLTPPTTVPEPYVLNAPFEDNLLTRDRQMWDMMADQIRTYPDLSLGGPSYVWLREAIAECNWLARQPSPKVPCVAYLGTNERIVLVERIHERMERWPGAHLELVNGGEHEVLMEGLGTRGPIFEDIAAHFFPSQAA